MVERQQAPEALQAWMVERAVSGFHVVCFSEVNRTTARHLNRLARSGDIERSVFGWSNPKANVAFFAEQRRREGTSRRRRERAHA